MNAIINRRHLLGGIGAAAAGAAIAGSVRAQGTASPSSTPSSLGAAPVLTRAVPRTGQQVSLLGLGTFLTFDRRPGEQRDDLREVYKRYVAAVDV